SRTQTSVVALQACLSVVLMTGAGLLARSFMKEQQVNPGFRSERLLSLRVDLPAALDRSDDRQRSYDEVARALEAIPGVVRVTSALHLPLRGGTNGQAVAVPPETKLGTPGSAEAEHAIVAANYFDVLRIPILVGRAFGAQDTDSVPPVGIVSESFARR